MKNMTGGFHDLIGLEVDTTEEGWGRVTLQADERHLNRGGTVHGGCLATLIDVAMGAAVFTTTGDGERPVTVELKVNYLEPGQKGTLVCTAELRKRGRRFTVIEAEVTQDGDVVALANGTFTTVGA